MLPAPRLTRRALRAAGLLLAVTLGACRDATTTTDPTVSLARRNASSAIAVTISGLPAGTAASGRVTGPNAYTASIAGSVTLSPVTNGSYTLTANRVSVNGVTYAPSPASQTFNVGRGTTARVSVNYAVAPTTGTLNLTVTVPNGAPGAVTVTNGGGFTQTVTSTTAIPSLAPGSYTVTAAQVTSSSIIYTPTPASQVVSITAGNTATATVGYASTGVVPSPDFNMQILGLSVVQSVQKLDNSVPLITGRNGVLRVYAIGNGSNSATPKVRVRLYQNGALVSTLTANAGGASVPTALNEASATASWNVSVPGTLIQPGLSVLADVDPDSVVAESSESDNRFPINGVAQPLTVRTVAPLNLRFVPITQSATGATGNITAANAEAYLQPAKDMLPVGAVNWTIREPYTTTAVMGSDGAGWGTVVSEIRALRAADASSAHYYGVLRMPYTSGVVGMGYIGLPASIGWDYGSNAPFTMAHELGHNFNTPHAPCGGVSGADPAYPYAGGISGVFGFNVRTNMVIPSSTADLMGYCSPRWISDYNYNLMMNYRGYSTSPASVAAAGAESAAGATVSGATATDGLLVWGRIDKSGALVLEPAVQVTAPSQLPARGGEYTLTASDASGRTLYSTSFSPAALADDAPDGGAGFAFVIPMSATAQEQVAQLTISGRGRRAERASQRAQAARAATAAASDVASESAERARVKWNAAEYPMVVVRDAETGRILSFARGGNASIATRKANLELTYTDGVRSASTRIRVRGR